MTEDDKRRISARRTARLLNNKLIQTILTTLTQYEDIDKFKKYVEGSYIKQNEWIGGVYDAITVIEEFFVGKDGDRDGA